jgi:DNA mismatch endonuclease (patch repair protein)
MAAVRSRDTIPEKKVRSVAHRLGFRFSLRRSDLPGSPDLAFPRLKKVIFVHGCFWHRHPGCSRTTLPATNRDFWKAKFDRNTLRDIKALRELQALGWKPLVVWECELKLFNSVVEKIKDFLEEPQTKTPLSPRNGGRQKPMH